MIGIRKAEALPYNITNDEIHYILALPSADASAISTDFVRLLRPIYNPPSFATRAHSEGVTNFIISAQQRDFLMESSKPSNTMPSS